MAENIADKLLSIASKLESDVIKNVVETAKKHPLSDCAYYFNGLAGFDEYITTHPLCRIQLSEISVKYYPLYSQDLKTLICVYNDLKRNSDVPSNLIKDLRSNIADIIKRIMPGKDVKFKEENNNNNDMEDFNKIEDLTQPIANEDVKEEIKEDEKVVSSENSNKTKTEFMDAFIVCRDIFVDKLKDYGPSWRIFRPQSVTDQLFIKGTRIRSLEELSEPSAIDEGVYPEFCALVNYGIIALIQLELGYSNTYDITSEAALELYDKYMKIAFDLMVKKNHDYDEAWRMMRICSYTDFILVKLARIKQIEDHGFDPGNSEGVDSNYLDIINYSIFGLIKLKEINKS